MPRYNFLDEAGLKKYHQLAGYSTIPITAITNYTFGVLDINTGAVMPIIDKESAYADFLIVFDFTSCVLFDLVEYLAVFVAPTEEIELPVHSARNIEGD